MYIYIHHLVSNSDTNNKLDTNRTLSLSFLAFLCAFFLSASLLFLSSSISSVKGAGTWKKFMLGL